MLLYLAGGVNRSLSMSFNTSVIDAWEANAPLLRSSTLWSCKLALLAMWGVGGGRGGGGGGGGGCSNSVVFSLSVPFTKEALDVSKGTLK